MILSIHMGEEILFIINHNIGTWWKISQKFFEVSDFLKCERFMEKIKLLKDIKI